MSRPVHALVLLFLVALSVLGLSVWQTVTIKAETTCDVDCLSDRIAALTKRVTVLEASLKTGKKVTTTTAAEKETFVQIGGGTLRSTDWAKVTGSEVWLDLALYGNVTEVTWQGWLESRGKTAQVRLYDATNSRVVDNSEMTVSTSGGKASFYSAALAIWRGQNQYYIQVRSPVSEDVTVSTPRLKLVTK